jgi:hypothetical protein
VSGFEQVLKTWRAAAVPLNSPASDADLRSLTAFLGDAVPPDLLALYSAANGMVDAEEFECLEDFLSRYTSDPGSLDLFEAQRR